MFPLIHLRTGHYPRIEKRHASTSIKISRAPLSPRSSSSTGVQQPNGTVEAVVVCLEQRIHPEAAATEVAAEAAANTAWRRHSADLRAL